MLRDLSKINILDIYPKIFLEKILILDKISRYIRDSFLDIQI